MRLTKNTLGCLLLVALCAGCSSITNLTASRQHRNKTGLYPVEAAFQSTQQSLISDSIQPKVVIGLEEIPMERVPLVVDRWQAYLPVPADQPWVRYHFKFNYEYYAVPVHRADSLLSPEYKLTITDK